MPEDVFTTPPPLTVEDVTPEDDLEFDVTPEEYSRIMRRIHGDQETTPVCAFNSSI